MSITAPAIKQKFLDHWTQRPDGTLGRYIRILQYAQPYRLLILTTGLLMCINITFSVTVAWIQQGFIDAIHTMDIMELTRSIKVFSTICLLVMMLMMTESYLRTLVISYMRRDLSVALFSRINNLPFAAVQQHHSGDLTTRISGDVEQTIHVICSSTYIILYNLGLCVLAFAFLARIDWYLALLVLGTGPITFLVGRFFDRRIRTLSKLLHDKGAEVRSLLQETLQGMNEVRAYGLQGLFQEKYKQQRAGQKELEIKNTLLQGMMHQTVRLINHAMMILLVYLITLAAVEDRLSIGAVLAFLFLMGRVQWPFISLSQVWGTVQQGLGASDRIFIFFDRLSDKHILSSKISAEEEMALSESSAYAIEFKHVSFSHPNKSTEPGERTFIENLNLAIRPGEIIALVGYSGSGKTTIARLCCGLYEPDCGEIEIYGNNIKDGLYAARQCLSYVPQMPYLFSGTIQENIAFGKEDAALADIHRAALLANAHSFIEALKDGYDTQVGEHGAALSGGQRQRVALARAFLREAPLIILDEATSALDHESEELIQASMAQLLSGRTALVIAHRLSTIQNAHRIIVMDQGSIAEEGTHEELLAREGLYAGLYHFQFKDQTRSHT